MMRARACFLALLGCVACDRNIPDLNNPGVDQLEQNPTPTLVNAAATGLLIGNRAGYAEETGYILELGIIGREAYNFDSADPRYVSELLGAPALDPGNGAYGGNFWSGPYRNIRNANHLLHALDIVPGMTGEEKEAIRGFALTIQALDYLIVINTHDTSGAVIDVDRPIGDLGPIVNKDAVLSHIADELDQAQGHLMMGGAKFSFPLSSGYEGFDTPPTFLTFNRALKARVDVYRKDFARALTDLAGSFLSADPVNPKLTLGVYHAYGKGSGDTLNGLVNPNIFAHPSVLADAEHKMNGDVDDRVQKKLVKGDAHSYKMLTSDEAFTAYSTPTSPAPIIRNEELILLRAEAHIGIQDYLSAQNDINFIRTNSGGLAPRTGLNMSNALDELLTQKRYSLLFEGGHRWIDMRRYGKLDQLPLDQPTFHVHTAFPIPVTETDARM